jgi:hypothetical protein
VLSVLLLLAIVLSVLLLYTDFDTPVPSINKTDSHDIAEILVKVELNTKILSFNSELNGL